MKQTIFTLLLFSILGLLSCRKDRYEPNIQQYDQSQIQSYIAANNITGMIQEKDSLGVVDTTGIYYKILIQPPTSTTPLTNASQVSLVFSLRSFDGKYTNVDTILNHFGGYVGHITTNGLPYGLELAILNDLKYSGGSMRILIPSRLAYGLSGYGSGSSSVANTRIAGNQCLDYYVHIITTIPDNTGAQAAYDDQVIQSYMKGQNLTGYTFIDTGIYKGLYYKIAVPGTGTEFINQNSTITTTREGRLLDNSIFDDAYNALADTLQVEVPNLPLGEQGALSLVTSGATVSMLIPSGLAYGNGSVISLPSGVPESSCIRYEYEIKRIFP
jgi:FKBP-type peptidyl-prolyl cis-trans isomerase FkpA